jgi:hypothetical protein
MRAHTIKIMSWRRRNARRRRALALALGVCALAIPASAYADPASSDYSRADAISAGLEESSQSTSGSDYTPASSSDYTSLNAITGPSPNQPTFASGSPPAGDRFDWTDAVLGAGAAMALVAFGGAALLTVRRRTAISPSPTAS